MRSKTDPTEVALAVSLQQRIADGDGKAAFSELYATFQRDGAHSYETVTALMAMLARMYEFAPATAAYLMVRLVAPARHYHAHDVSDAVGLYLEHATDRAVATALKRLVDERMRPAIAKGLLRHIERIEQRS
jgi:hypothetical protein